MPLYIWIWAYVGYKKQQQIFVSCISPHFEFLHLATFWVYAPFHIMRLFSVYISPKTECGHLNGGKSKAVTYAFPPGYRENAEEEEEVCT
jgi:hypothetical protein